MPIGCVYCAVNTVNGKAYVGKTVDFKKRLNQHRVEYKNTSRCRPFPFYLAIRKYGWESFDWWIIFESDNEDDLFKKEIESIAIFGTYGKDGYNCTRGGEGASGRKHTEESKRKMSEASKGNTHNLGHKHTEEAKRKMSEALKGRKLTDEHRRNMSEAMKGHARCLGHKHTEEAKRNMSKAGMGNTNCLGYKHSEETKSNMSKVKLGHKHTEEAKRNMSKASLGRKHTEETKRKLSKVNLGRKRTEESKRKMSEAQRKWRLRKKIDYESKQKRRPFIYPPDFRDFKTHDQDDMFAAM